MYTDYSFSSKWFIVLFYIIDKNKKIQVNIKHNTLIYRSGGVWCIGVLQLSFIYCYCYWALTVDAAILTHYLYYTLLLES